VGPLERLRRKSSAKGRELLEAEPTDPAAKLDQDYIQMFLGKLEPMQESRLVQLKQCMSELQKDKAPSDPVVLRFLRARDFNVDKAREMLSASLIWRKKHGVDKILCEYQVSSTSLACAAQCSVADTGSGAFLTPGSGTGKFGSGSRMNNMDHISESLEKNFWGLKYLNSLMRIRDGKNSDPG
jgi:hypothetical protein